jgi:hypothetical protein
MDALPWEIVSVIGANLLPKYRCRLYICTKLWYSECYWRHIDIFNWHKNSARVHKDISRIRYITIEDEFGDVLSWRSMPQYAAKYDVYYKYYYDNIYTLMMAYAPYKVYCYGSYVDTPSYLTTSTIDESLYEYNAIKMRFLEGLLRQKSTYVRRLFNGAVVAAQAADRAIFAAIKFSRRVKKVFARLQVTS